MSYEDIKNKIETVIRDNNTGDITAEKMRELLSEMIDAIDINHRIDINEITNYIENLQFHDQEDRFKMPIFFNFTMSAVNSDKIGGTNLKVLYSIPSKCFCVQVGSSNFSAVWNDDVLYNSRDGYAFRNKLFIDTAGETYYFDGSDLRPVFDTIKGSYHSMDLKIMMLKGELLPGFWYQVNNYLDYGEGQLEQARAYILKRPPLRLLIKAETSHSFARKAKFITDHEFLRDSLSLNEWEVDFDIFGKGYALTNVPPPPLPDVYNDYFFEDPLYKGDATVFISSLGYIYQPGIYKEFQDSLWGMCKETPAGFIPITEPAFRTIDYFTYAPVHCGVVTRMKDHRGNEAPFDFWHICSSTNRLPAISFNNIDRSEIQITNNIIKPCKIDGFFAIPPVSLLGPNVTDNLIELDFKSEPLIVDFIALNNTITNSMIERTKYIQDSTLVNCSISGENNVVVESCDIKGGVYSQCFFSKGLVLRADYGLEIYGLEIDNSGYVTPLDVVPFATDTVLFTVAGPDNVFSARRGITWIEYFMAAENPQFSISDDRMLFLGRTIVYTNLNAIVRPTDVIIGVDAQPAGYIVT